MNENLWFAGDPHGDFRPLLQAAQKAIQQGNPPAAVILLGDLDLDRPLEEMVAPLRSSSIEIWWIHGNHDCDRAEWYDRLFESGLKEQGLHGRVVEIAGLRVAGLGGVFRERVWRPPNPPRFTDRKALLRTLPRRDHWRGGLPRKQRCTIFREDYERLWTQRADILVCHEAPSCHPYGFEAIDELAEAMGVKKIIHGHHHEAYRDRTRNGIEVVGVGLCGVHEQTTKHCRMTNEDK